MYLSIASPGVFGDTITVLGTASAPSLHSLRLMLSHPELPAYDNFILSAESGYLEKIPPHIQSIRLGTKIDLGYLADFLATHARKLDWRQLVLPRVPKSSRPLCEEICDSQGINAKF
ncbi:hypothetical protein RQP46_000994 [Phenoliferia psychrophenolica]